MVGEFVVVVGDDERLDAGLAQSRKPGHREAGEPARVRHRRIVNERNAHFLGHVVSLQRIGEIDTLPGIAQPQLIHPLRREHVRVANRNAARIQRFRRRLDRLRVLCIRTRKDREGQDARIFKSEVLQDEAPEQGVLFPELVVDPRPESVAVGIALGIVQEVIPDARGVRQRLVQRNQALGRLIQAAGRNRVVGEALLDVGLRIVR